MSVSKLYKVPTVRGLRDLDFSDNIERGKIKAIETALMESYGAGQP